MADVQFNLRIPEELKDRVKDAAKESGRSINAEAQYRLEQTFNTPYIDTVSDTVITELLEGTVSKLLEAIKTQGVPQEKIQGALESLTNKKAP